MTNPRDWHHIAVVLTQGQVTLYVDGQPRAGLPITLGPSGRSAQIGHTFNGAENWRGGLDEVAVYSEPLSAGTVAAHYQALGAGLATFGTDVTAEMQGIGASAWIRVPFVVADPGAFDVVNLRVQVDDGFAAFLNGTQIAALNAPAVLDFASQATGLNSATVPVDLPLSGILPPGGALRAGTNVLAFHGLNLSAGDGDFYLQPTLVGQKIASRQPRFFPVPTPGGSNNSGVIGLVRDTVFSHDRGFYETNFAVGITSETPGALIYWTTNGTVPSPTNTNAFLYTAPIPINRTRTLRAAAYREGWAPTDVDTHTYIFLRDVLTQPEMDRRVVTQAVYSVTISNDLRALPTLSLVMPEADLFGANGIYANPFNSGFAWERGVSAEWVTPDGDAEFQIDAGLRIHGGDSRNHAKKGFELFFRREYGAGELRFPLFADSRVSEFDKLVLRSCAHDAWTTPNGDQPTSATYSRDMFIRTAHHEMGGLAPFGSYVHLYLNGRYWGLYNPTERTDEDFVSSHQGGADEDWDVIQGPDGADLLVFGTLDAWNAMLARAEAGVTTSNAYAQLEAYLDIDAFIDYMLLRIWAGDVDWLQSAQEPITGNRNKNWFAARRRVPAGRFNFFVWDNEFVFGKDHSTSRRLTINITDVDIANSPGRLYTKLRQNAEFRVRFGDRLQRHLFSGGTLAVERNLARWDTLSNTVWSALVPESARWGDAVSGRFYTRDAQWLSEVQWVAGTFFPQRNATVLGQFRAKALFPSVGAPLFNQLGGGVPAGFALEMAHTNSGGAILFTLDGSDPRLPGGATAPAAQAYASPIVIQASTPVRARVLQGTNWSALVEAVFHPPQSLDALRVTEIMYHSPTFGTVDGDEVEKPGRYDRIQAITGLPNGDCILRAGVLEVSVGYGRWNEVARFKNGVAEATLDVGPIVAVRIRSTLNQPPFALLAVREIILEKAGQSTLKELSPVERLRLPAPTPK